MALQYCQSDRSDQASARTITSLPRAVRPHRRGGWGRSVPLSPPRRRDRRDHGARCKASPLGLRARLGATRREPAGRAGRRMSTHDGGTKRQYRKWPKKLSNCSAAAGSAAIFSDKCSIILHLFCISAIFLVSSLSSLFFICFTALSSQSTLKFCGILVCSILSQYLI